MNALRRIVQIIGRCNLTCCEAAERGRVSEGPIYSAAMPPLLLPLQMLLLMFAGWVNRHQLDVIEYLQEENRVLKERMGGRRLRFTDYSHRRGPGRPRVMKTIVDLVLQIALENPSWGYTRIRGALTNLGHQVGRGTIANILRDNGIEPAPERDAHTRWSTFLHAHWECLTATDFMSVEVCTFKGLVT
jgi:putative transposase